MLQRVKDYCAAEYGAVSVDWVVLTAALVGLAIAVITIFGNSTTNVGDVVGTRLTDMGVGAGLAF